MMIRHTVILASIFTLLVSMLGCASSTTPDAGTNVPEPTLNRFEYARVLMGSKARIVLYAENEQDAAAKARTAFDEIRRLNQVLSDYDTSSESMRLTANTPGVWHSVSSDLLDVLQKSTVIWDASGGAFDPSVGPITHLWRDAASTGALPREAVFADARSRVGLDLIQVDAVHSRVRVLARDMVLDFGGIGKGYAAGRALEVLRRVDAPIALVDLGGDIALGDPPPGTPGWSIAIETGLDSKATRSLSNCGVATSGDLYRFVEIDGTRYSHIVDPRTGMGLSQRVAFTVIAEQPWLADALASACSVLGEQHSRRLRIAYPEARVFIATAADDRTSGVQND